MLLERFLKPVGFMLEIPWRLSCSNMPGTVGQRSENRAFLGCLWRLNTVGIRVGLTLQNTNRRSEALFHDCEKLMVDVDGQVAENLSVFWQVKIVQAVLQLARRILFHELLSWTKITARECQNTPSSVHDITLQPKTMTNALKTDLLPTVLLQTVE